jgi:hypothetical protein
MTLLITVNKNILNVTFINVISKVITTIVVVSVEVAWELITMLVKKVL